VIKIRAITEREWNEQKGIARFRVEKRLGKLSYGDWLKYTSRFLQAYGYACGPTSNVELREGGHVFYDPPDLTHEVPGDLIFELKGTNLSTLQEEIIKNITDITAVKDSRLVARIQPVNANLDLSFADVEFTTEDPKALRCYVQVGSSKHYDQNCPEVRKSEIIHRLYEDFRTRTLKEKLAFKISDA